MIDTNVYTTFKRNDAPTVSLFRRVDQIGVNPVVTAELLAGFRGGDRDTAEHYASVYTNLRRKGRPIPTNDMWIAASALQHGMALASQDNHFSEIDGLLIV